MKHSSAAIFIVATAGVNNSPQSPLPRGGQALTSDNETTIPLKRLALRPATEYSLATRKEITRASLSAEEREMDVRELRYFIAAYEEKGFARASSRLGTVQSNVSSCIRNLEKDLGVELFERRYRSLHPTEGGERLYRHARHVIDALDLAEHAVKAPRVAPRSAGFTLLELLVVVAIIGLLAGFVAPRYFGQVSKSEIATAKAQLDAIEKAL